MKPIRSTEVHVRNPNLPIYTKSVMDLTRSSEILLCSMVNGFTPVDGPDRVSVFRWDRDRVVTGEEESS